MTTAAGKGTAVYNGDGTFTYTATAGQEGLDTFQYTITDQDGDTSTATVTVNLGTDSVPSLVSATNLTVDEDGFLNAANDTVTARTDETDSTESLTASGTAVVNFGSDVPANLLGSIVLVDTPALDGQLHTHDGQSVTFALSGGDLVGSAGATEVIRIHLVSAAAGPGAGNVTYTYSTTLSQPLEHADGALENAITLTGVTVQVTDSDSDTLPVSFNVTIVDDVPQANSGSALTVIETDGVSPGTNLLANDVQGADGATVTAVDLNDGNGLQAIAASGTTTLTTANGTYTFQANGTWSFDPNANLNNAAGISAGFTYQITDGDGDTSTATQAITINDGAVAATPVPVTLDLNEAALSTAGATGSNPSLTSEVDNAPALSFTAGSDNLTSFAFSGIGGLVTDLNGTGGQDIFWQLVSPIQIKGFLDAGHTQLAVTLDLSAPASIAAGATGTSR